ncbi:hypothetical protein TTHERM_000522119 (macronuclear) [Tetrahymena thermophila SB210]|uniref:Uncharacterized protein n=1 Tax=Tetrahymena thermophila (strain SB210) TaxID=312017 RepID=W7XBG6_TETTS|nr:hypothetical protein TTHERM_000522119 [Tetrahymena thermophila SB210]EWS74682.1 hypothetical protein TTHERM_000522119 [Tetrahymena thermophila SB210]|eukprot:XP_012652772.1 hypothetical protein TTHERM_000522119 [Tetrahymena thermophila SB210]
MNNLKYFNIQKPKDRNQQYIPLSFQSNLFHAIQILIICGETSKPNKEKIHYQSMKDLQPLSDFSTCQNENQQRYGILRDCYLQACIVAQSLNYFQVQYDKFQYLQVLQIQSIPLSFQYKI